MVVMYACVVTCGRSFTVSSVWGVLISFLECFCEHFLQHFFGFSSVKPFARVLLRFLETF